MGYKRFVSLNVAVIGEGNVSDVYTAALNVAGHEVFLAGTGEINSLWQHADNVTVCSIEEAAERADFIIIATEPKNVREVAYWLGDVRGKVIIDVTANVVCNDNDRVNTARAIAAITGAPHITKIFNTAGYEQLLKPIFGKQQVQMILAGDSRKAKEITKIIAKELGINKFYDFGGDNTLPLFEEMTKCWRDMLTPEENLVSKLRKV